MLVSMTAFWVVIQELLDVIRPACLIEIGGDQGECTQELCEWASAHQALVHVIETHPTEKLNRVLDQYELAKLHIGPSLEILPSLEEKANCFVIDGDHNYYTVSNELRLITQHNTPDLILLHDVCWPWGHRDLYYDLNTIPEENRQDPVVDLAFGILPGHPGIFHQKGFRSSGRFAFAKTEGGSQNGVRTAVQDFLNENPGYAFFTIDCVFGLGIVAPKSSPYYAQIVAILAPYVDNPLIKLLEQDRLRAFIASLDKLQPTPIPAARPAPPQMKATKTSDLFRLFKEKFLKKSPIMPAPSSSQNALPLLSVVIVVHNMQRVALRTLRSFGADYQGLSPDIYEVIIVENGSDEPLSRQQVAAFGPNFRYFTLEDASPSPVGALNFGVKQAKGQMLGMMIDGAHLVTPGILKYALRALKAYKNPVVSTLAMQLGSQMQRLSIRDGYSEQVENALLQQIDWPKDGYKLFGISTLTGINANGWFSPMLESNCVFLLRRTYDEIGGFDKRFDLPGGGLANLDFYNRLCEHPAIELITLLGEASFHQIHGGISTNNTDEKVFHDNLTQWMEQYKTIRGKDFKPNARKPEYWGSLPPSATPLLDHSIKQLIKGKL